MPGFMSGRYWRSQSRMPAQSAAALKLPVRAFRTTRQFRAVTCSQVMAEKAETLRPDMILVGLCLNDILVYSESGAISEAGAEWKGQRLAGTRRLSRFLLRHSQLYAFSYAQLKSAMYSASAHHGAMATD